LRFRGVPYLSFRSWVGDPAGERGGGKGKGGKGERKKKGATLVGFIGSDPRLPGALVVPAGRTWRRITEGGKRKKKGKEEKTPLLVFLHPGHRME